MRKNVEHRGIGLSFVELVIIIGIIAVLIGVLTPQYKRYVEQSKMAADEYLLDEIKFE